MVYLLSNFKQKVILCLPENSEQNCDTVDFLDSLHSILAQQSHPSWLISLFSNTQPGVLPLNYSVAAMINIINSTSGEKKYIHIYVFKQKCAY